MLMVRRSRLDLMFCPGSGLPYLVRRPWTKRASEHGCRVNMMLLCITLPCLPCCSRMDRDDACRMVTMSLLPQIATDDVLRRWLHESTAKQPIQYSHSLPSDRESCSCQPLRSAVGNQLAVSWHTRSRNRTCLHVEYNFDHPQAFDISEISRCLDSLKRGNETLIPEYDFNTHSRSDTVEKVKPAEVIMFEGILVLHVPEIVERLNMKVCAYFSSRCAIACSAQAWGAVSLLLSGTYRRRKTEFETQKQVSSCQRACADLRGHRR